MEGGGSSSDEAKEAFENIGGVVVSVQAVGYLCGAVGVLNSREANRLHT